MLTSVKESTASLQLTDTTPTNHLHDWHWHHSTLHIPSLTHINPWLKVWSPILVISLERKRPAAKSTRGDSTEVGGITKKALCRFFRSLVFFLPAINDILLWWMYLSISKSNKVLSDLEIERYKLWQKGIVDTFDTFNKEVCLLLPVESRLQI